MKPNPYPDTGTDVPFRFLLHWHYSAIFRFGLHWRYSAIYRYDSVDAPNI